MTFIESLEITLELAIENIVAEKDCDSEEQQNARFLAIEATERVADMLDVLRGEE